MAAVAMSAGVAFSQGMSLGKSEFAGKLMKQSAATIAPAKFQNAAVSVRAAGYDEELVKTAVRVLFLFFLFFGVCVSLLASCLFLLTLNCAVVFLVPREWHAVLPVDYS
jgi:hypothetical protein